MRSRSNRTISVIIVSDSTGETARTAVNAAVSQFSGVIAKYDVFPFVRGEADLDQLSDAQLREAELCAHTIVKPSLSARLHARCLASGTPGFALLDPLISNLSQILGATPSTSPGQQYTVDASYLNRIRALDFAIGHDDGLSLDHLMAADVVLTGVSRTSKTPTCIYLAYQGIKAANVPLILDRPPPQALQQTIAGGIPVIGLTASAVRLAQIRQTRLRTLGAGPTDDYSAREAIEAELVQARLFFERHQIPVIDVTRRSIEETAASVRHHLEKRSTT